MKLLVNALSIGSMSGEHVVYGFLRPLSAWLRPENQLGIIHYEDRVPPQDLRESGVELVPVSTRFRPWHLRTVWEAIHLRRIIRRHAADVLLNVSGSLAPNVPVPQVVLCQNPWCFVPEAHYTWQDRAKARLQRIGYGRAFRNADMMVYISQHLRDLYAAGNPGQCERESLIAWVGLNDSTFEAAKQLRDSPRDPNTILSVSAMAPWKGAHTLVEALATLRSQGNPAKLKLVGPWPDQDYESRVKSLIETHKLGESVQILGRVSDEDLHYLYATARVFCLMSTCESFGIPAAEAMAFGTPVISSNSCAIAEVCEGAGIFGPHSDPQWTATALASTLRDTPEWNLLSSHARKRSLELSWSHTSRNLHRLVQVTHAPDKSE